MAADDDDIMRKTIHAFGVAATVLAFSAFNAPAFAEESLVARPQRPDVIFSSSIQVSETISTMDFSLPSSYDAISDAKSSAVGELVLEENLLTGNKVKKAAPKKAKSSNVKGSGSGGEALTPEEKAQLAIQKKAEREAAAAEKQAEKAALAAEKAAQKEVQSARRAVEKVESTLKGAEFVDMSLPSYGDSAGTAREKSVFSLWEWVQVKNE